MWYFYCALHCQVFCSHQKYLWPNGFLLPLMNKMLPNQLAFCLWWWCWFLWWWWWWCLLPRRMLKFDKLLTLSPASDRTIIRASVDVIRNTVKQLGVNFMLSNKCMEMGRDLRWMLFGESLGKEWDRVLFPGSFYLLKTQTTFTHLFRWTACSTCSSWGLLEAESDFDFPSWQSFKNFTLLASLLLAIGQTS